MFSPKRRRAAKPVPNADLPGDRFVWTEGLSHVGRGRDSLRYRGGGSTGSPFGDPAIDERYQTGRGVPMTLRHQTWLTDTVAGSALLVVLYFALLNPSRARWP